MHDPVELIRDEIRRSVHGEAWHGPALLEAISDISDAEANARPLPNGHNIAEIALHALAWIEEVTRRLGGHEASEPERGDWPEPRDWRGMKELLTAAASALDRELASLPAERLDMTPQGETYDAALGTGSSTTVTLHGLAQHNAYHCGQISLLKRALRK